MMTDVEYPKESGSASSVGRWPSAAIDVSMYTLLAFSNVLAKVAYGSGEGVASER